MIRPYLPATAGSLLASGPGGMSLPAGRMETDTRRHGRSNSASAAAAAAAARVYFLHADAGNNNVNIENKIYI